MLEYDEKRNYIRMNVDCELTYKRVDSGETFRGNCTSISGSGVSFIAEHRFELGTALEINIVPKNSITPPMTAFIEVVRALPVEGEQFEIAGTIKSIKGN